jgi:ESCRT-II complex subunit VPS36
MFLHQLDLTTALRPSLLPEETLLFVQDAVGLYEGYALDLHTTAVANRFPSSKFKIPQYQHGQAYLTSHRTCYVDHSEPRKNSVAIFLKDVEKTEFYVGTLPTVSGQTMTNFLEGRLLEVFGQDHSLS